MDKRSPNWAWCINYFTFYYRDGITWFDNIIVGYINSNSISRYRYRKNNHWIVYCSQVSILDCRTRSLDRHPGRTALSFPIAAAIAVIWILGLTLMVDGFSRIADGLTNKSNKKWIRGFTIAVGVLAVIIAFMIISSPAFGAIFASIIISITLLIIGIEMLTTGISGHKGSINIPSAGSDMR